MIHRQKAKRHQNKGAERTVAKSVKIEPKLNWRRMRKRAEKRWKWAEIERKKLEWKLSENGAPEKKSKRGTETRGRGMKQKSRLKKSRRGAETGEQKSNEKKGNKSQNRVGKEQKPSRNGTQTQHLSMRENNYKQNKRSRNRGQIEKRTRN